MPIKAPKRPPARARPPVNLALFVVSGFLIPASTIAPIPAPTPAPIRVPPMIDPVAFRARISRISSRCSEIECSMPAFLLWQTNPFSSAESKEQKNLSLLRVIRIELPDLMVSTTCHPAVDDCARPAVAVAKSRLKQSTKCRKQARILLLPCNLLQIAHHYSCSRRG